MKTSAFAVDLNQMFHSSFSGAPKGLLFWEDTNLMMDLKNSASTFKLSCCCFPGCFGVSEPTFEQSLETGAVRVWGGKKKKKGDLLKLSSLIQQIFFLSDIKISQ